MITIDVYSDVICPWCFIGKRRLEKGIALTGRAAMVRWHPFELNSDMPDEGVERRAYRIKKFGSWERSLELDAGCLSVCATNPYAVLSPDLISQPSQQTQTAPPSPGRPIFRDWR